MQVRVVRPGTLFLAWLLLAAGAAAGAWFAVDAAGGQVGEQTETAEVVPALAAPTLSSTPSGSTTPATSAPTRTPSTSPSPSASPSPSPGRGMFNWRGGGLVVRCEETAVKYWAVRPGGGWRVRARQTSDSVLEVVYEGPGGSMVLVATCRPSGPLFSGPGGSPPPT